MVQSLLASPETQSLGSKETQGTFQNTLWTWTVLNLEGTGSSTLLVPKLVALWSFEIFLDLSNIQKCRILSQSTAQHRSLTHFVIFSRFSLEFFFNMEKSVQIHFEYAFYPSTVSLSRQLSWSWYVPFPYVFFPFLV